MGAGVLAGKVSTHATVNPARPLDCSNLNFPSFSTTRQQGSGGGRRFPGCFPTAYGYERRGLMHGSGCTGRQGVHARHRKPSQAAGLLKSQLSIIFNNAPARKWGRTETN
ncbi:hypothetical protein THAOC_23012 [Thalassiosira oceanica]|uniref:Uncharacterized protein n=1 Tax=Thalassiosira oceanica TaxID=159749 RepID=K0SEB8_THAOC|nr:hypothetical protein THAOC_23012 [Thalassiosira oceanica]|eukprot:EJK56992.1 hypothetical protein THAOC_23012 [Thalassiosira oceanica]